MKLTHEQLSGDVVERMMCAWEREMNAHGFEEGTAGLRSIAKEAMTEAARVCIAYRDAQWEKAISGAFPYWSNESVDAFISSVRSLLGARETTPQEKVVEILCREGPTTPNERRWAQKKAAEIVAALEGK